MAVSEARLTDEQQHQLSEILWGYRNQLKRVEVLLEAQLLFANSGRDTNIGVLADLLDEAALAMGQLDLRREILLGSHHPGDPSTALALTLTEASERSDEPWADILLDHRQLLLATVQRIQALVDQSRHTMGATLEMITQMANGVLDSPVLGYDRSGQTVRTSSSAVIFDGQA